MTEPIKDPEVLEGVVPGWTLYVQPPVDGYHKVSAITTDRRPPLNQRILVPVRYSTEFLEAVKSDTSTAKYAADILEESVKELKRRDHEG